MRSACRLIGYLSGATERELFPRQSGLATALFTAKLAHLSIVDTSKKLAASSVVCRPRNRLGAMRTGVGSALLLRKELAQPVPNVAIAYFCEGACWASRNFE